MVCSAPEMTMVSKPNKKPASAEVMAQKTMRAFIFPTLGDVSSCLTASICMGMLRIEKHGGDRSGPQIEADDHGGHNTHHHLRASSTNVTDLKISCHVGSSVVSSSRRATQMLTLFSWRLS